MSHSGRVDNNNSKEKQMISPSPVFPLSGSEIIIIGHRLKLNRRRRRTQKKRHVKREHFPGLLLTTCIWKYTWIALKLILWQKIQSFVFVVAVVVFFCLFRISKKKREYYWNRAQKKIRELSLSSLLSFLLWLLLLLLL